MASLPRVAGRGCLRGVLVQLAVLGVTLGSLAVCLAGAAVFPSPRGDRGFVVAGTLALWVGTMLVGAMAFGVLNRLRLSRRVDAAFAPLGLTSSSWLTIGRQLHGDVRGRHVDAYFGRGPMVEVWVTARIGTRVAIAPSDGFTRTVQRLTGDHRLDAPALPGQTVGCDDAAWAGSLLADLRAVTAIRALLDDSRDTSLRVVQVQPGTVGLVARGPLDAVLHDVAGATGHLVDLAVAAESLTPPATWTEPSQLAVRMRTERPGTGWLLMIVAVAVGLCLLLSVGLAAVVVLAQR